ncbi:calcium sensing receptor, chloroplastic-like [Gossypium australe]|uniref:Calcium sensing receptor, chloroplastic-like n=1 Tax=Gossypium australe TaxID=47621 RepID=A0A5B6WED1_9ROSI|nr:calcium sensing receptor, chloroplastic-like [Gossypium australe]
MLPVCSATPGCSSHSQLSFHGGLRPFTPFQKDFQFRCNAQDKSVLGMSGGNLHRMSFKPQAMEPFYTSFAETTEQPVPMDLINNYSCPEKFNDAKCNIYNVWSSSVKAVNDSNPLEEKLVDLTNQSVENANNSMGMVGSETISTVDTMVENPIAASSTLNFDNDSLSGGINSLDKFLTGFNESFNSSVNRGENAMKNLLDKITSSITSVTTSASEAVDNAQALADNKVSNLSNDLNEASNKANAFAVDLLRRTIVVVENSLFNGASSFGYYYWSAKERLPPEIKDALTLYEERTGKALKPVGAALQQVYTGIEGVERSLGFDPSDPIVPFFLLFGTSATLWVFYWVWAYGGYSGDLSPKLTLELLSGKENAFLIDVRPEVLRERDGIPDLRRVARFRYACVSLPEVNGLMGKVLKSGRDLDDSLIAVVIRNLKTIEDRSKVIIMDADGSRSKGIARSLRSLGVKRPYLVQGGFQSWVNQGLRVKELKPETALSILNEEAEAILEDINPSPVQVLGYGVGSIAAIYALLEWEKSLQLIGILGLVLTVYRRVSLYENAEDLKKDLTLLLGPAKVGAVAYSWIAGKLETNGIGLSTSPSSLDVQNRVLQAAAKLESQPSNAEDPSIAPINEKVDLSEA